MLTAAWQRPDAPRHGVVPPEHPAGRKRAFRNWAGRSLKHGWDVEVLIIARSLGSAAEEEIGRVRARAPPGRGSSISEASLPGLRRNPLHHRPVAAWAVRRHLQPLLRCRSLQSMGDLLPQMISLANVSADRERPLV